MPYSGQHSFSFGLQTWVVCQAEELLDAHHHSPDKAIYAYVFQLFDEKAKGMLTFPQHKAFLQLLCTCNTSSYSHQSNQPHQRRGQGLARPFHRGLGSGPALKPPFAGTGAADHGSNRFPQLQITSWDHFLAPPPSDHLPVFKNRC